MTLFLILLLYSLIISSIEIMSELNFYTKDLAETSNSFFHRTGFSYRNEEKAIDFGLLRQTQKQRIINLFKNNLSLTQDKLLCEFDRIQEQSNQFIQTLLEQLALESKKNRQIHHQSEGILREKNIYARKLAQKNIQLVSTGNVSLKQKQHQIKELEKELQFRKIISQNYQKQVQGLKKLLNQYEQQLQQLQQKLQQKTDELKKKVQTANLMVQKIDQLNKQISKYKQKEGMLLHQVQLLSEKMHGSKNLRAKLQLTNIKFQETTKRCKQLQLEICQYKNKEKLKDQTIIQLQTQILNAQQINARQIKRLQKINSQNSQQIKSLAKKQFQSKIIMQELEAKTKASIQKLKQNYQEKMKKILRLLQKQVKHLRSSFQNTKQFVQKQVLLCFSLIQREWRNRPKSIQASN